MNNEPLPELNERVLKVVNHYAKGNVSKFSDILNEREFDDKRKISQQRLNRLFNVDTRTDKIPSVTTDVIQAISKRFPEINITWLLTGEGPMLLSEKDAKPNSELARADFLKIMDRLFNLDALEKRVSNIESRLGLSSEPVPEDKDQNPPREDGKKESKNPS